MNLTRFEKKKITHKYSDLLNKYCLFEIANEIGITHGYLRNVLGGHFVPSKKIDARLCALAEQILAAEKNQELQEVTG